MRPTTIWFAFIVVVIDAMGIGLLMPVLPEILSDITGKSISGNAQIAMWLTAVYAFMQFVFGPLIGALSDRFGRRPVLLLSIGALGIDYILLAVAPTVALFFIGRLIAGIAGATQSTAFAVAADLSTKENRVQTMGLIFAGFGVGFILGPALGGLLGYLGTAQPEFLGPTLQQFFGQMGNRAPMYFAAALSLGNLVFGYFFFKESLSPDKRRAFQWSRANPVGAVMAVRSIKGVYALLAVIFIFGLAQSVYPNVWSFFARAAAGWDVGQVGLSLSLVGIGFVVVQAGMVGPMTKRFGDAKTVLIGMVFNILAFGILSFATQSWILWAGLPISAMGVLVGPTVSAMLSKSVDETRQGEVQGIATSLGAISYFLGPFVMTGSFVYFTKDEAPFFWPGAPFAIATVLVVLCVPLTLMAARSLLANKDN